MSEGSPQAVQLHIQFLYFPFNTMNSLPSSMSINVTIKYLLFSSFYILTDSTQIKIPESLITW